MANNANLESNQRNWDTIDLIKDSLCILYQNLSLVVGFSALVCLIQLLVTLTSPYFDFHLSTIPEHALIFCLQAMITAGLCQAILNASPHQAKPSLLNAWQQGAKNMLLSLPIALLFALSQVIGLVLLGIPFILITVFLWPLMVVAVVEKPEPKRLISRCLELTRDYRWSIFILLIIIVFCKYILSSLIVLFFKGSAAIIELGVSGFDLTASGFFSLIVTFVYFSILSGFIAVLTALSYQRLVEVHQ